MERYAVTIVWHQHGSQATVSALVYDQDGNIAGQLVEAPADFDAPIVALALAHHLEAFPRLF